MRKEYDFEKMKGKKNPYAKHLKKQVTIRMGVDIIDYFKIQLFSVTRPEKQTSSPPKVGSNQPSSRDQ